jgi:hypothetical protein
LERRLAEISAVLEEREAVPAPGGRRFGGPSARGAYTGVPTVKFPPVVSDPAQSTYARRFLGNPERLRMQNTGPRGSFSAFGFD